MKSIKKFENKKIENMHNIQGGFGRGTNGPGDVTKKTRFSNRDRSFDNGLLTNSSWFRENDVRMYSTGSTSAPVSFSLARSF